MKILIWLGAISVWGLIQGTFSCLGITLGAIPTVILLCCLWIPTRHLARSVDIKKYNEKFSVRLVGDAVQIIASCKNDFLVKKNFNGHEDGLDFFDLIKEQFLSLEQKEVDNIKIEIIDSELSPYTYVLKLMETQSLEEVKKGDKNEIIQQKGRLYVISKVYEYSLDMQLENERITSVQYENKCKYVEQICNGDF